MFDTIEGSIFIYIVLLLLLLVATVIFALVYSGLLSTITVAAGTAPIGTVTIAYKYVKGPYSSAGPYFTDTVRIAPKHRCLGIYYDDPRVVAADQLRFAIAMILSEDSSEINESVKRQALSEGYQMMSLPSISYAVKTAFPYRSFISIFIAIARVYPQLNEFIKTHKLCAHPMIEIYDGDKIHFMAPLSRQEEFYVKEVTPTAVTPKSVAPKSVAPKSVTPKSVTPKSVTPKSVTPTQSMDGSRATVPSVQITEASSRASIDASVTASTSTVLVTSGSYTGSTTQTDDSSFDELVDVEN